MGELLTKGSEDIPWGTVVLELQPSDEFDVKLGKKAIRLVPVGGSEKED